MHSLACWLVLACLQSAWRSVPTAAAVARVLVTCVEYLDSGVSIPSHMFVHSFCHKQINARFVQHNAQLCDCRSVSSLHTPRENITAETGLLGIAGQVYQRLSSRQKARRRARNVQLIWRPSIHLECSLTGGWKPFRAMIKAKWCGWFRYLTSFANAKP